MASLLPLLSSLLFFSAVTLSAAQGGQRPYPPVDKITQACKATLNPGSCTYSLTQSARAAEDSSPMGIVLSAIGVSYDNLKPAEARVKSILDSSAGNKNRSDSANTCFRVLSSSQRRLVAAEGALKKGLIKDARAWMSAALGYQYECWSKLKYVNDTDLVVQTMNFFQELMGYSSNALGMLMSYDNFGQDLASWGPPKTERDGFWEKTGTEMDEPTLGVPADLKPDATVCKRGIGCYKTVQEAVDAAPANATRSFVILIQAGVYEETVRVPFEKQNLVFLGEGIGKTVITGSLNTGQQGIGTYDTATVSVVGDRFMARGITFQNTAGPVAHQAVAFGSESDFSVIEDCEFIGNQDTLYVNSLRQFYKSCRIQGNVDFIFGNAAAFFQDCVILVAPRQETPEKGETNAITANGRTDPGQMTGFVFRNCTVTGTPEYMKLYTSNPKVHKNFLGRPWKDFSRTVFLECNLDALIHPDGWSPWSGDIALKTLYYGEYKNTGPGAAITHRVPWSSQVPEQYARVYSMKNFIQVNEWIKA